MTDDMLQPPERSTGDAGHAIMKAGLSFIPLIGGAAVEIFQYVIAPPLEKRRNLWMAQVGEKLLELETTGLKLENLQGSEEFVSTVMYATQIAMRTHITEKLNALRNAIINVAIGQAPEEALQHVFLNLVDTLTELHLRILKVFQSPTPPPGMSFGGLSTVLEHNIPELRGRRELYDQLWKDLYSRGLVDAENLQTIISGQSLSRKCTSGIGDAFLKFIEEPTRMHT